MAATVIDRAFALIGSSPSVRTLDLTGGAPELHPQFRDIVRRASETGIEVIDRNNLTVLFEPSQKGLPEFLAENGVHVVASLPCYTEDNVDRQRGGSVFEKSIKALNILNGLGYGVEGSGLVLDLVYNPGGASLPGDQDELDRDYHSRLWDEHGISFNRLFAIANVPIARFRADLERDGGYDAYMDLLRDNFNAAAADTIMCRNLVSIGWDGSIYDCDFNQALGLRAPPGRTVFDIESFSELSGDPIHFGEHCFACAAGAGSSCFGATEKHATEKIAVNAVSRALSEVAI